MPQARTKLTEEGVEIIRLGRDHAKAISSFKCEDEDKNLFLKEDALSNQGQKLSETFLLFEKSPWRLVSYITLSLGSFKISTNREFDGIRIRDKPYRIYTDHIPCLFIAKLATDIWDQGRDGATLLIRFAIKRGFEISEKYPLPCVALDSKPDKVEYYKKRGFPSLSSLIKRKPERSRCICA